MKNVVCQDVTNAHLVAPDFSPTLRVRVTLQLTVSQSVCLDVEPRSRAHDQIFIYFCESYCPVPMGRPL
jgi:hypothetical protein